MLVCQYLKLRQQLTGSKHNRTLSLGNSVNNCLFTKCCIQCYNYNAKNQSAETHKHTLRTHKPQQSGAQHGMPTAHWAMAPFKYDHAPLSSVAYYLPWLISAPNLA